MKKRQNLTNFGDKKMRGSLKQNGPNSNFFITFAGQMKFSEKKNITHRQNMTKFGDTKMKESPSNGPPKFKLFDQLS